MSLSTTAVLENSGLRQASGRVDYLDGWRGMAIILVLLSHFFQLKYFDIGRMGVDIFFVLSGMLMANILFVKKVQLSTFYKRRISRIFPVFFIYITVFCGASYLFDLSGEHNNYLSNLLFLRSYIPEEPLIWQSGIPNGHLWSLNVEEHCYILLSLLTILPFAKRYPGAVLILLGLLSIAVQYIYIRQPEIAPVGYHLRTEVVASFLLLSAGYFLVKGPVERWVPSWASLVTLLLAFYCYAKTPPHWTAQWAIAPILLAFSVNHLHQAKGFLLAVFNWQWLRMIGIWSYSIYLWQQPFYYYGVRMGEPFPMAGVVMLMLAIAAGVVSFYLIENPLREWINKKWAPR